MQCKYAVLCAPLLLASAAVAQSAPAPSSRSLSTAGTRVEVAKPTRALAGALNIARVRLGSRTEGLGFKSKLAGDTLLGIHGAPDATITRGEGGFVLRDIKAGRDTVLGIDLYGGLPSWAASTAIQPSQNSVSWLYNRGSHAMCFVVDDLGFVDAISVAGSGVGSGAGAPTLQAEGIEGNTRLGDDIKPLLRRFGFPDTIESHEDKAAQNTNPGKPTRTFELRYDVAPRAGGIWGARTTFTVRDNHVLRFYAYRTRHISITAQQPPALQFPIPQAEPKARLWLLEK